MKDFANDCRLIFTGDAMLGFDLAIRLDGDLASKVFEFGSQSSLHFFKTVARCARSCGNPLLRRIFERVNVGAKGVALDARKPFDLKNALCGDPIPHPFIDGLG